METIFYDGHCGLCHALVRFVAKRDHRARFEFAPLSSAYLQARMPAEKRRGLPDSVVVLTGDGRVLVKGEAVRYVLTSLGGVWGIPSFLMGLMPAVMLDFCYDGIAGVRKRVFAAPKAECPALPAEWRGRFRE